MHPAIPASRKVQTGHLIASSNIQPWSQKIFKSQHDATASCQQLQSGFLFFKNIFCWISCFQLGVSGRILYPSVPGGNCSEPSLSHYVAVEVHIPCNEQAHENHHPERGGKTLRCNIANSPLKQIPPTLFVQPNLTGSICVYTYILHSIVCQWVTLYENKTSICSL